jgi:hypothetical protein
MNLHKLVRYRRHEVDAPLFTGRVARKYRRPPPEPPEEVFRETLLAAFDAIRGMEIEDVFPANQTANVKLRS